MPEIKISCLVIILCVNGVAATYLRELCVTMEDVRGCPYDCGPRQLAAFHCLEFKPLLDSGASRTADLQCATVCHQPCTKTCHWLHLRQNWKRIFYGVHNDSRRPPDAVAAFSRFRRRDISDYLLTYLLRSLNIHLLGASRRPIWSDMIPIDICEQWREYWLSASVVNHTTVTGPTIRQPGSDLTRQTRSLLN